MPKRNLETLEPLPVHNFQSNPGPSTWTKRPKTEDKADQDSDSDDDEIQNNTDVYDEAILAVSEGMKTEQMKVPAPLQLAPSPAKPIRVRNKNSDDNLWILKFEACKEYIEINGNSNIQTNYECTLPGVDGKCKLGIWLNRQKFNKKSNVLRDDRFQMLDQLVQEGKLSWPGEQATTAPPDAPAESTDVGVDHTYSIGVTDDAAWIQKVNLLKSLSREGNSNITSSYVSSLSDGTTVRLGLWLKKQRQMRKGGMLKPNREAILQQMVDEGKLTWSSIRAAVVIRSLGEQGKLTDDEIWDLKLMALVNFIENQGAKMSNSSSSWMNTNGQPGDMNANAMIGNGTIPINSVVDINGSEVRLGLWLKKQRQMYRNGSLRADRKDRLQVLVDRGLIYWQNPCKKTALNIVDNPL